MVWVPVFVLSQGALAADLVESWSLDDDAAFVSTGDTEQWAWGTISSGPGSSYDGETAWATVLDGDYLHDSTDELTLASVDLTSLSRPVLGFVHWYDIDQDDGAWVEIFSDGAWQVAEPIYGYASESGFVDASGDWETSWFDLTGLDDSGQVRFVLSTDTSVSRAGWYLDNLVLWDGDPVPPSIRGVSELPDTQDLDGPYVVSATVVDDLATPTVELVWSVGDVEEREILVNQGDDLYEGEIPGQEPDTELDWWIEASDGENLATSPDEGVHEFRVYLAAPTDLTFLDDRLVGTEIELDWTPPDSPHEVLYYRIYRDDEFLEVGMEPPLHVGVEEETHTFEVAAFYDSGEGDRSESLEVDVYLPEVTSLIPAEAWQGDQVRVEVRGSYLLFAADGVEIEMGVGIETVEVEVRDVEVAVFTLTIDEAAQVGTRDVVVTSGEVEVEVELGFEVLSGDDRPMLISVEPDSLVQGEHEVLTVESNADFEEIPLADLGDGLIVESISLVGPAVVEVQVAVALDAPLGEHDLELDDGVRILEGVTVRVRDPVDPPSRICATGPRQKAPVPWWWALAVVLCRRKEPRLRR